MVFISFFCIACVEEANKKDTDFQLKIGDLLFQDLDSSPLCDAIELVTPGYKNGNFSHIGIIIEGGFPVCKDADRRFEDKYFYNIKEEFKILEAIPGGVQITSLDSFLMRSSDHNNKPKVIAGRLKLEHQWILKDAIPFLRSKIGVPYDDAFIINNDKYYCAELIYEAFLKDSIFKLRPMTFLKPDTKDTLDIWEKYYSELAIEIPQNKLGINPGIMSLSDKIEILHLYGIPDGMEK